MATKNKNNKKKTSSKKAAKSKPAAKNKKKPAVKHKPAARPTRGAKKSRVQRGKQESANPLRRRPRRGLGSEAGGQSGDTQGLRRREDVDSESVEELSEEGQYLEADAVEGVEDAKDPDEGEVTTSEFLEDDVPSEYDDEEEL